MTFLYESNIGSSLSLKSAVDVITEKLMSINETGSQGDYNGPIPFITSEELNTLRNNTVFNKVLANVFQNIKTDGLDCKTFVEKINSFVNKSLQNSFKQADIEKAINLLDNLYVTVFKDSDEELKKNTFYIQKNLDDITFYDQDDDVNMQGIENLVKNNGKQNFINVNKESSFDSPHMFVTMINSPNIRASLQNELEMHTFLNSYNSLEFSKCIPYVDIKMKSPRYNETYETRYRSNANIASFLYPDEPYVGLTRGHLLNKYETASNKKDVLEEINIGTFSMPQTAVNLNGKFGLIENNTSNNENFSIVPHDLTRPFMTINKLDLDVQAAAGLIAYKSGTLSLVLHDRTRMKQIAGFLDPSLQGLHGPNITIEFGWSHPSEPGNVLGRFLNESRVKETYIIVNSNFTMEKDGSVNIDLSIAQISGRLFTSIPFETSAELTDSIKKINHTIKKILASLGVESYKSTENVNLSMFDFNITSINEESTKKINKIINKLLKRIENIYMLVDVSAVGPVNMSAVEEQYQFLLELLIGSKDDTLKISNNVINNIRSNLSRNLIDDLIRIINDTIKLKERYSNSRSDNFLKKIIPNITTKADPFFDRVLFELLRSDSDIRKKLKDPKDYVTFGAIVSGLIATHLPKEKRFTDIQLYSYTCNSNCGYMSNRNIFSILIKISDLKEKIKDIIENNAQISLQGFITNIYTDLVRTEENHSWGIFDLYEEIKNKPDPSKPLIGFKKNLDLRLAKIYKDISKESYDNKIEFRIPFLQFVFNAKENKSGKVIFKVSFYDKQDNPSESLLKISNAINTRKIKSVIADYKSVKSSTPEKIKLLKNIIPPLSNDAIVIASKSWLEYNKKVFINKLFTEESVGNKTKLTLKPEYNYNDLKKNIKTSMPSITYGTEASAVTSASLSSMNDPGLSAVKLARAANSRKKEYKESKINANLPYHIFPTTVGVELIGCPHINFNQAIFVDFQTGTTADNVYAATGIKHSITPGNFKTTLTLTPHDAYGYYETHINGIEGLLNSDLSTADIEDILEKEEKKEEVRKKKAERADPKKTSTKAKKAKTSTKTGTKSPASTAKSGSKLKPGVNCLVIALKAYGKETKHLKSSMYTRADTTGLASTAQAKVAWKKYKKFVDTSAAKHGIDASFLWAIMAVETGLGRPEALKEENPFGALGLMQFVRTTGKQYNLKITNGGPDDDRRDPAKIIDAAARLLIDLQNPKKNKLHKRIYALVLKHFPDDAKAAAGKIPLQTAIAMYNSSPQRVIWGLEGKAKLKTTKTGKYANRLRVVTRTRTALTGSDFEGRPFTSKGPRLFPFDETFARYIHPLLTFKKHLDECFAKHAVKEEAAKAIKAPPVVKSENEDDDDKIPAADTKLKNGEISKPLTQESLNEAIEVAKSKGFDSKKVGTSELNRLRGLIRNPHAHIKTSKPKAKEKAASLKNKISNSQTGCEAVYLMSPAREFRIFSLICLSIPFFSKSKTQPGIKAKELKDLNNISYELDKELKDKLFDILKNIGNENTETNIINVFKEFENKNFKNGYAINFDFIVKNLNLIEKYYKDTKKELNKNITGKKPQVVYNLINATVPQNIEDLKTAKTQSSDVNETNVQYLFNSHASPESYDGLMTIYRITGKKGDIIQNMCIISRSFYESIVDLYEKDNDSFFIFPVGEESGNLKDHFSFAFVRYCITAYFSIFWNSESRSINGKSTLEFNIINDKQTSTESRFKKFKKEFELYDKSISTNILERSLSEFGKAKNSYLGFESLELISSRHGTSSFFINDIIYLTNIKIGFAWGHIRESIEKFNTSMRKTNSKELKFNYNYVTASIIVPDRKSLPDFTENKFKKYFDGKGLLLDLNLWFSDKVINISELAQEVDSSLNHFSARELFIKFIKDYFYFPEDRLRTSIENIGMFYYNSKTNNTFAKDRIYLYLGSGSKTLKPGDNTITHVTLYSNHAGKDSIEKSNKENFNFMIKKQPK